MRSGGSIEIICGYIKAVFCVRSVAITNIIFWGVSELKSMSEFRIWLNFKWSLVGPPLLSYNMRPGAFKKALKRES